MLSISAPPGIIRRGEQIKAATAAQIPPASHAVLLFRHLLYACTAHAGTVTLLPILFSSALLTLIQFFLQAQTHRKQYKRKNHRQCRHSVKLQFQIPVLQKVL